MRARLLDILFLVGIAAKGIDGVIEIIGGAFLLWVSPGQLADAAKSVTAEELREDPHDLIANLLLHGVSHLGSATTSFLAAYLLLHGVVKIAIIVALITGSLKVYPWAIGALTAFLVFQGYELITQPSVGVAVLTVIDLLIVLLTWREWRQGRTLRETWRSVRRRGDERA